MRRTIVLLSLGLVLTSLASAQQDWARALLDKSPRHQEWVTVKHGGRSVQCFVVYPEVKDKAPAILLIHEIFGLSDWARSAADQAAAAGYIAIEPDLLSGMAPGGGGTDKFAGQSEVIKAVWALPPDQVTADLNAAADYAKALPSCNGHLAVAGFCWGGGQSFRFATNRSDLKVAFVFYGPTPDAGLDRIACPVYGFYAGDDARISSTVPKTAERMKAAGKTYHHVIYDGAGHGFMRAGSQPDATPENKAAHDAGWKKMLKVMTGI